MEDRANDPHRLVAAAHELGHAIVWRVSGFTVTEIWVKGRGLAAHGHVWLAQTDDQIHTVTAERHIQAGLLAGREAQRCWCDHTGEPIAFNCDVDDAEYRRRRRTTLGRLISRNEVRATANRLVRTHWHTITRLAPHLARTGHLSPARLPR